MPQQKAQWTVLNYIAAHNNLDQFGGQSRKEIVSVGSSDAVVQGLLFDSNKGSMRCVVGEPGLAPQRPEVEEDVGRQQAVRIAPVDPVRERSLPLAEARAPARRCCRPRRPGSAGVTGDGHWQEGPLRG